MEPLTWVRGQFQGHAAYVEREVLLGRSENCPIAPEAHVTDGELNDEAWDGISLAHVYDYDGRVMCFQVNLGTLAELFTVDPTTEGK